MNYLHVTRRRLSPHTVGSMEEKIGQTHGPSVIGTGDFLVSPSLQNSKHYFWVGYRTGWKPRDDYSQDSATLREGNRGSVANQSTQNNQFLLMANILF